MAIKNDENRRMFPVLWTVLWISIALMLLVGGYLMLRGFTNPSLTMPSVWNIPTSL